MLKHIQFINMTFLNEKLQRISKSVLPRSSGARFVLLIRALNGGHYRLQIANPSMMSI